MTAIRKIHQTASPPKIFEHPTPPNKSSHLPLQTLQTMFSKTNTQSSFSPTQSTNPTTFGTNVRSARKRLAGGKMWRKVSTNVSGRVLPSRERSREKTGVKEGQLLPFTSDSQDKDPAGLSGVSGPSKQSCRPRFLGFRGGPTGPLLKLDRSRCKPGVSQAPIAGPTKNFGFQSESLSETRGQSEQSRLLDPNTGSSILHTSGFPFLPLDNDSRCSQNSYNKRSSSHSLTSQSHGSIDRWVTPSFAVSR